jgi:tetratricopeptide (TPR) repeat protein
MSRQAMKCRVMSEKSDIEAGTPGASSQLQDIVYIAETGDIPAATAKARELRDSSVAGRAWRFLSDLNANLQRWGEALEAIDIALQHSPESRDLRQQRAVLLELSGDDGAALAEFEALVREGGESPQLLVHLAGQLASLGRMDEAQHALSTGLSRWPAEAALHTRLARLLWQRGAGIDSMRTIEGAIRAFPQELQLRLVAADLLRNAGEPQRALELLEEGLARAPESATFRTSIGTLLEGMDRVAEALTYLREACRRAPHSVPAQRNLIPALLRSGAAGEARAVCDRVLAQFPDDQMLIAQRATALRLLGDPDYPHIYDYARLVQVHDLRPPAPYTDIAAFNAEFGAELMRLHRASRHPLEQSLRGGSQTERHLPRNIPVIATFFAMLDAPIRAYVARLGSAHGSHPVDRRNRGGYRISGSWSVQLHGGGFHINHVHPRGWLSSAYYVALPDVSDADSRAGWLKFGEPGINIPDCPPEYFVQPRPGRLALFPSYMWHGTVAFTDGGPRLTAAFDVVPA